jgi:hypothetical protein
MNRTNSCNSPSFRIKQLPLNAYTARTKLRSSEPAATTIGMSIYGLQNFQPG